MRNTSLTKTAVRDALLILLGSLFYGLSTVLFIFPQSLLLGGTSGISVILETFLPVSPGTILMVLNLTLLLAAFVLLGRGMAVKTLLGSLLTTLCIGGLERILTLERPLIADPFWSAAAGAGLIALASGVLFYVDSSSGGTDILALIVRKFSGIQIGRALLVTDILIVLVGGFLAGWTVLLSSVLGLLIKTFGIDLVIGLIRKFQTGKKDGKIPC